MCLFQPDINECSNSASCGANSQCVNLPGTYGCDCNSGYTLRSGRCTGKVHIYPIIAILIVS